MNKVFLTEPQNEVRGLSLGLMTMENLRQKPVDGKIDAVKRELEDAIRVKYRDAARADLKALHPMDAYIAYYRKYGYTYHVLPQLESVIKGKAIPSGLAAVEAMFMAELKNLLLSAVHDLDKLKTPLFLKTAAGDESYTAMGGREVTNIPGDFLISDQEAVFSSILRGPDQRSAISADTSRAIFMIYAPAGVEEPLISDHLRDIESYVRLASPDAVTGLFQILHF